MSVEEQREVILAFLTHEQDRLRNGEATPPFQIVWGHLVINWLRARLNVWEKEIES